MKQIIVIEDSPITGIKYGTVEVIPHETYPIIVKEQNIQNVLRKVQQARTAKIRAEKTKHK